MSSKTSDKSWLEQKFHDDDQQRILKPDQLNIKEKDFPPFIKNKDLLNRIKGSIFGLTIGDALGAHVEFRPHSYLEANPVKDLQGGGTWGLEKGQFTDDTSMALCLANSLIFCQDFVPYDQLVRYKWWYRNGYMSSTGQCFDIGAATRQSIQQFEIRQRRFAEENDIPLKEMDNQINENILTKFDVNCSKEGVAGNGALMRLAPVPLFFYNDPIKAIEYSGISGQITHGDEKAIDACRYYGALIVAALQGMKKDRLLSNTFYNDNKQWFGDKPLHVDIMNIANGSYKKSGGYQDGIRGKGYVVDALQAALWAFCFDQNSFEKGVLDAVNLGDDTDTTAAIYGQLAGAYYGYQNFPERWIQSIYAKDFLLCITHWIEYEGNQWFDKQRGLTKNEPLINSDPNPLSNISDQRFSSRSDKSLKSMRYSLNNIINRKAINNSNPISFFYNAYEDCLVESSLIDMNLKLNEDNPTVECINIRDDQISSQNILQLLGFDDELTLSLMSNITSPNGIASVIQYPYLIDEYTRILYYSKTVGKKSPKFPRDQIEKELRLKNNVTHLIQDIHFGIDIIILLRLSSNLSKTIDDLLENIKQYLINNKKYSSNLPLDEIISIHIYSNINYLTKEKTLIDLIKKIDQIKINNDYQPTNYILSPIQTFLGEKSPREINYFPIKSNIAEKIFQHLIRSLWINKVWRTKLDQDKDRIIKRYLKEKFEDINVRLKQLNQIYEDEKKRLQKLIIDFRHQKSSEDQIFNQDNENRLKNQIDDFIYSLTSLIEKISFIDDLNKRDIKYQNANFYQIQQNDNEIIIQQKLFQNNPHSYFLCSNDILNSNNASRLDQLCSQLSSQKKSNQNQNLIYVDFTYSFYELDQMKIYPLINTKTNPKKENSLTQNLFNHQSVIPKDDQTIYILLLGKSGVGKSTLINNLSNCLESNRYGDILSNQSVLSVFISFCYSIQSESEEHLVRIGNINSNENNEHSDQSTTQLTKLYYFKLNNEKKLCIIDTPGWTKTNCLNDDKIILDEIISSISDLSHIDAFCFLIQSNDIQINSYQLCLNNLFQYFGENILQNIFFYFSKTFLNDQNLDKEKNLIKSIYSQLNKSFNPERIFHFDSSFFINSTIYHRLFSNIFDDGISQKSWQLSKSEWKRFFNSIQQNFCRYSIKKNNENVEICRLRIKELIRPLFETLRNCFRNSILSKCGYPNCFIQLNPISLSYPSSRCYSCPPSFIQYGEFWITSDSSHYFRNQCSKCFCHPLHHIPVDYKLQYKYLYLGNDQQPCISYNREEILEIILNFFHFLCSDKANDPFCIYLNEMIDEERLICERTSSNRLNLSLYHQLKTFKDDYQRQINQVKEKNLPINDLIKSVQQIPMVKIQLDAKRKL